MSFLRCVELGAFTGEAIAGDAPESFLERVLDGAASTWELACSDHAVDLVDEGPVKADGDLRDGHPGTSGTTPDHTTSGMDS
jgi:hypothetical protein